MKKWLFTLFLLICVIQVTCKNSAHEATNQLANSDSTAAVDSEAVFTEQSLKSDIWSKYSFEERRGKRLYEHYCVVCHGISGRGDGFNSFNLDPRPHSFADSAYVSALSDEILKQVIAYGGRGVNKSILMPAYQNTLSTQEIQYIVDYIRTFSGTDQQ